MFYDPISPHMHTGYGQSEGPKGSIIDPASFVEQLISSLGLDSPVIISPSMSGGFSLPYLTAHPGKVRGFVPVAPVKTQLYADKYPSIKVGLSPLCTCIVH